MKTFLKKANSLSLIIFRMRYKKTFFYFNRWKVAAMVKPQQIKALVYRNIMMRNVLKTFQEKEKNLAKVCIDKWKFQVDYGFPFHRNRNKLYIERLLYKMNYKIKKIGLILENLGRREHVVFTHHHLYLAVDRICEPIETAFSNAKRKCIRKMKVLYETELCVIEQKQKLMLRTLSVNVPFFKENYGKQYQGVDALVTPMSILTIMQGSKDLKDTREYISKNGLLKPTNPNYYARYLNKSFIDSNRKTDSRVLVTGIWATRCPFFRLREFTFIKLLQRNYLKWTGAVLSKLKFHKYILDLTNLHKSQISSQNLRFRKVWSRFMLSKMLEQRVETVCSKVLFAIECKRCIASMQGMGRNGSFIEGEIGGGGGQGRGMGGVPMTEENIDQLKISLSRRLKEIKRLFPKSVLLIILDTSLTSKEIFDQINRLIIESVFYVVDINYIVNNILNSNSAIPDNQSQHQNSPSL